MHNPIDDDRGDYIRRLVTSRCPELSPIELAAAFVELGPDADVLVEIAAAAADAISALESRLEGLEQDLPPPPRGDAHPPGAKP